MAFTPHVINIDEGEDISTKSMSFSQQGPRVVCILSANGAVSTVTLPHSATSGGRITYEGRFEILCMSGSFMVTNGGGSRVRTGGLSVSLSGADGRVIGGGVAGLLKAATPVQVIVGSFTYTGSKAKIKPKSSSERGGESETQAADKPSALPCSPLTSQDLSPPVMGGWSGSRQQLDMRNTHMDIDLTRG